MVQRKLALTQKLHQKAEDAWLYFCYGFEQNNLFSSYDEAKAAWQLVKGKWYRDFTIGAIDGFGYIEYLPEGYWMFDCPGAPFKYKKIKGLYYLDSCQHQKFMALKAWQIIPQDTIELQLTEKAKCYDEFYQAKMAGKDHWYPFPTGTKPEEKEATWNRIKAARQAWVKLGYLKV